jgi:hypothetical protein
MIDAPINAGARYRITRDRVTFIPDMAFELTSDQGIPMLYYEFGDIRGMTSQWEMSEFLTDVQARTERPKSE